MDKDNLEASVNDFKCYICEFTCKYDYWGKTPPFAVGIKLKEDAYVMKDPFTDQRNFITLGSVCSVCSKSVCVGNNCSYFYSERFCLPCIRQNIETFPEEVQQEISKRS